MVTIGPELHPEAHLVLRPSNVDNGQDPWQLELANGPCDSNEAEHQAVIVAYSEDGDQVGVEYLRWVADMLAGAIQRNLIVPEEGDYVMPNGTVTMMTPEMKARYASTEEYLTWSEGAQIAQQQDFEQDILRGENS